MPGGFGSLGNARARCLCFVSWYNHEPRQSRIAFLTPGHLHHGRAPTVLDAPTPLSRPVPTASRVAARHRSNPNRGLDPPTQTPRSTPSTNPWATLTSEAAPKDYVSLSRQQHFQKQWPPTRISGQKPSVTLRCCSLLLFFWAASRLSRGFIPLQACVVSLTTDSHVHTDRTATLYSWAGHDNGFSDSHTGPRSPKKDAQPWPASAT